MIFDTLEYLSQYASLHPGISTVVNFIHENDLSSLPAGRMEIDGKNLYILVQEYLTKPVEQGIWEAHRRYIDIQIILSGQEQMGFAALSTMQSGEYAPEKDFQSMTGAGNFLTVFPQSFVIFFPEDAHMPCLNAATPEKVRKIVFKIRINPE